MQYILLCELKDACPYNCIVCCYCCKEYDNCNTIYKCNKELDSKPCDAVMKRRIEEIVVEYL